MIRSLILFSLLSLGKPVLANNADFMHCYDFGCKSVQPVSFSPVQWQSLGEIFARPALSPWLEKQQIRAAVALMERFSGSQVGTERDKGGNYPGTDISHQQDCIDESTNTLQYLLALEQRDWLRWHEVEGKQRRVSWLIFIHWTAVIRDVHNDELYAVDSWYLDNGAKPYVQKLDDWRYRSAFPVALNP